MSRLLALALLVAFTTIPTPANAGFVNRSVPTIMWAIAQTQPSMGSKLKRRYAAAVRKTCKQNDIDPFTIVSIADHESHWIASTVSPDGEDFGLGQIRARFEKRCNSKIAAAKDLSPGCQAAKARLLNGVYNIARMGKHIKANRRFCRKKTRRSALFARWMASYGGYNRPARGIWCNQKRTRRGWRDLPVPSHVRHIMKHRVKLIRKLRSKRRNAARK